MPSSRADAAPRRRPVARKKPCCRRPEHKAPPRPRRRAFAAIVLGSLEHFPQYRDVFHAVSVRAVAQDPRYVTLARMTEAPTDDEAAAVAADALRGRRRWARPRAPRRSSRGRS